MLQTVFRNLISNAVKFTPKGGQIRIAAKEVNGYIEILVSDTGVGIAENKLKTLFNIDKRRTSPGTAGEKGTGLGLVLCKEFIERQGGNLWLESQPGKGSTFIFTLPLHPPTANDEVT
jgi:signal transduction histidine kinase